MSADPRESILARLATLVGQDPDIRKSARNVIDVPESIRPFASILDGDEEADGNFQHPNKPAGAPHPVIMRPMVVVTLGGSNTTVGSSANAIRSRLIKSVLTDATLQALALNNSAIFYSGCEFSVGQGRETEAEMILAFEIIYYLKPLSI